MVPQAVQEGLREDQNLVSTRATEIESATTEKNRMEVAIEGIGIVIGIATIEEIGIEGVKRVMILFRAVVS